jgi:Fic family protein
VSDSFADGGVIPARLDGQTLEAWVESLPFLFTSNTEVTADVSAAARKQLVRKVGPRLYTKDRGTPVDELLRKHALVVAASRFPGHVISHRSALEMRASDGQLFLTGPSNRIERLEGLTIKVRQGPGPLDGDQPFLHSLYCASPARAFLENLAHARRSAEVPRTLSRAELELRLEALLRLRGEDHLNQLRDHARRLAPALDAEDAFVILDAIISALCGTRPDAKLQTPVAIARRDGAPYDAARVTLFELLADELQRSWSTTSRPRGPLLRVEIQHLAFVDAYFSNYIEGTTFEVAEAMEIVFEGKLPSARPADAHDVLGTFELLADNSEMLVSAREFEALEDFEHLLKRRHLTIMDARVDKRPGEFKQVGNQAGATVFVAPELVRGTLERGLGLFHQLDNPFARAVFMMFLVAEVHPFDDGNGRLARAMMNAELAAAEEDRILVPTSYRPDYLGGLRRLSRQSDPSVYVRMLDHAHEFTARLDFGDLGQLLATLESCNAFDDSERRIMKLPPRRGPAGQPS